MQEEILASIVQVKERIAQACQRTNRNPEEVKLLLATKTVSAENIKIAMQSGETLIAENKVQELKEKFEDLRDFL